MEKNDLSKIPHYVKNKEECCGCGLCYEKCPKKAIRMLPDEYGFIYPVIENEKCINCGICKKICGFNEEKLSSAEMCYAAANQDQKLLKKSASGGIFSAIAEEFLEDEGIVCGSQMLFSEGKAIVKHTTVDSKEELCKLQGSKYVQSDTQKIFESVTEKLKQGKKVLFSGTPCQVAAIKACVGKKNAENLYTIDIICHGVPSIQFFNDYIDYNFAKQKITLQDFSFRDKKYGWGLNGSFEGWNYSQSETSGKINPNISSYYRYFLKGEIYRECCYHCPFAQDHRGGDLTIGDYWGIEKYNSELLDENGGPFRKYDGVSCIIVNSEKGKQLLNDYGRLILKEKVKIENIKIINTQLKMSATYSKLRKKILDRYAESGYSKVESLFAKQRLIEKTKAAVKKGIKMVLPNSVVKKIKNSK